MEQFAWLMDRLRVQAEWRSVSMECGEESMVVCVTIPELCADSWGTMSMQKKVVKSRIGKRIGDYSYRS